MARDNSLLEAALVGYQAEHARITAAIEDIQRRLGQRGGGGGVFPWKEDKPSPERRKHLISPEGLRRIREAQKRRWEDRKNAKKAS